MKRYACLPRLLLPAQSYHRISFLHCGVGQNIASRTSPVAKNILSRVLPGAGRNHKGTIAGSRRSMQGYIPTYSTHNKGEPLMLLHSQHRNPFSATMSLEHDQ